MQLTFKLDTGDTVSFQPNPNGPGLMQVWVDGKTGEAKALAMSVDQVQRVSALAGLQMAPVVPWYSCHHIRPDRAPGARRRR